MARHSSAGPRLRPFAYRFVELRITLFFPLLNACFYPRANVMVDHGLCIRLVVDGTGLTGRGDWSFGLLN